MGNCTGGSNPPLSASALRSLGEGGLHLFMNISISPSLPRATADTVRFYILDKNKKIRRVKRAGSNPELQVSQKGSRLNVVKEQSPDLTNNLTLNLPLLPINRDSRDRLSPRGEGLKSAIQPSPHPRNQPISDLFCILRISG